ncbi:unnamed protein product [Calypogeia fissa]
MELRMIGLVSHCPLVSTSPGRNPLAASGIESLAVRLPFLWQVKLGRSIIRAECAHTNCSGVFIWGKTQGEEKERLRAGGVLRQRHEWSRRDVTKVKYDRTSNSVAEAPTLGSEAINPELVVSEESEGAAANMEENREQQSGGGAESSSEEREEDEDEAEKVLEKGFTMSRICDRLTEVFLTEKTTPAEWRALLVLSSEWTRIRPYFYKRCKVKAKAETVAKKKRELSNLAKQVKEVNDQMILHDAMLAEIEKNPFEIDVIVASRRKEFTGGFFEHLQTLCEATSRSSRRDEIASISGKCLSLIEAYDAALEDSEAITEAQLKFDEILRAPSLEAAATKIDQLARSKELDSTLLLFITRAWVAARDSTTMKREAKDVMLYIYTTAKKRILKLVPDEIYIIKRLLLIQDPRERFAAMTNSFAPGDELEEKDDNKFHTTPDKLKHWMKKILDAYYTNRQSTMIKEAQKLMNPEVISRLEVLLEYMDESFIL